MKTCLNSLDISENKTSLKHKKQQTNQQMEQQTKQQQNKATDVMKQQCEQKLLRVKSDQNTELLNPNRDTNLTDEPSDYLLLGARPKTRRKIGLKRTRVKLRTKFVNLVNRRLRMRILQ